MPATQRRYTHNGNGVKAMRRELNPSQHSELLSRLPPQAIQLEEAVLGAMMLDRNALTNAGPLFKPEIFYSDAHQHIAQAIVSLFSEGKPIDILTVTEKIKSTVGLDKIGGGYYLVELTNKVASAANIEYHTMILYQEYIKRTVIEHCSLAISSAYDNTSDPFDLIDGLTKFCINSNSGLTTGKSISIGKAANNVLERVAEAMMNGKPLGISTGFRSLDVMLGGFFGGEMTVVAGRPGMGKTQLVLQSGIEIARQGKHFHFISLEMTAEQLATRVISEMTGISQSAIRRLKLTQDDIRRMQEASLLIQSLPFKIASCRTPNELWAYISMNKARGEMDAFAIDYLQLMSGDGNSKSIREQEVASISRTIKKCSTEFNIPAIALSQLSRAVESREDKEPMPSDLRESGSLEQDADNIIFIMRPEVYGFKEYSIEQTTMNPENLAIIIGAKMRSDSLFKLPMKFKNGVFSDYDSAPGQASASQSITVNGQTFTSEGEGNSIAQTMNGHRPGKDEDIPF